MKYLLIYSECGSYDQIEKRFKTPNEALGYVMEWIIREHLKKWEYWYTISKIIYEESCDKSKGGGF